MTLPQQKNPIRYRTSAEDRLPAEDLRMVLAAISQLEAATADLDTLPATLFPILLRLSGADNAVYTEQAMTPGKGRILMSHSNPDYPALCAKALSLKLENRFWKLEPNFYQNGWLRETDCFLETEFLADPMYTEVLKPAGMHHIMQAHFPGCDVLVHLGVYRGNCGPFSTRDRDRLTAFQPHLIRAYFSAYSRSIARMTAGERMKIIHPSLTRRQIEVLNLLSDGHSNAVISHTLGVGLDAVKAHLRTLYSKLGVKDRFSAAVMARNSFPGNLLSKATLTFTDQARQNRKEFTSRLPRIVEPAPTDPSVSSRRGRRDVAPPIVPDNFGMH